MAIAIRGMAPLLMVFDMPTSLNFYRDKLGFTLVQQSQPELGDDCGWALLRLNESEIMLNTAYENPDRPPAPDPDRIKAHEDTSIYFGCPDTDATYEYITSKGIEIKPPAITGYGFKALYLKDPDGYWLCFHWPV